MMEYFDYSIVTCMGVIKINRDNIDDIFRDLGIEPICNLGPYIIATIDIRLINLSDLHQHMLSSFYISYNGTVKKHEYDTYLDIPLYKVYSVYITKNGSILLCFNEYPSLNIDEKRQPFYVKSSKYVNNIRFVEVYNLYFKGDYHFIINPSDEFLEELSDKFYLYLTDNSGWILADGKSENKH
ncbi:MHC class II inhibitor [Brazilian porcupinepox virus 1]|nr:MHC class II inhibitor [Brazilian porcupinepox virus 1]